MKRVMILALALASLIACGARSGAPVEGTVASADGQEIRYAVEGTGDPAILFIHCWCCDRSYWKDQVPYFAKKYRVVTLDLAGHGASGLGRTEWTIPAFAADVAAVATKLDLKRAILVGHSMGGAVALEAARLLPGRAIGIVGVDNFQDFSEKYTPEQQAQFLGMFQANFAAAADGFVRGMFPAGADSGLVEAIATDIAGCPPEVALGAMKSLLAYDPAPALAELAIPIRNVNSDKWPTNVEGNKKLAKDYDAVIMPGYGHFLHREAPTEFNAILDRVIAEIAAKR